MAAQDRKQVVVVDGGYETYEIKQRILAPLGADVIVDPCHGDPARIKIATAEADAVLVRESPIDQEAIACMRRCRIIARYGIGVDNVNLAAAQQRRIYVANVPDYGAEEVSDHALALLMSVARRTVTRDAAVRGGAWSVSRGEKIYRIAGRALGLVGYGRIARTLEGKMRGLGPARPRGWQWLFIIEGIPSVLLGFVTLGYLTDRPGQANWLSGEERDWLVNELAKEKAEREARYKYNLWQALTNGYVLVLGFIYFALVTANNGLVLWQPQIIKNFGLSNQQVGFVNAIPFVVGVIAMILWGRHADRHREYRMHLASACVVASAGLAVAALTGNSIWALFGLSVAALGGYGALPTFWPLPTAFLSGTAAAGGIALVNSIGNLGGFAGPYVLGWLRDTTKGFTAGLYFLAASAIAAGIVAALARGPVGRSAPLTKSDTASS